MNCYYAIGIMSGTSLDGVDICYAMLTKTSDESWSYSILESTTIPYTKSWVKKLVKAPKLSSEKLLALHSEYGLFLGKLTQKFIRKNSIENVDLISSHGHTIFHQPKKKFTFQLGDGAGISIATGIPTYFDFRTQDVLLRGNGAPLVPIGDQLFFNQYDACLNLGGFSNISLRKDNKRIAFDISPVNFVLNHLSLKLGHPYDTDGQIARESEIDLNALVKLQKLSFYREKGPKSLGREWVEKSVFPILEKLSPKIALTTFNEHIALQISRVLNEFEISSVLITGGGAYNSFLLDKLKEKTKTSLVVPQKELIDYKEALIFALMGVLRHRGEINTLCSATGSERDHSSGKLA